MLFFETEFSAEKFNRYQAFVNVTQNLINFRFFLSGVDLNSELKELQSTFWRNEKNDCDEI